MCWKLDRLKVPQNHWLLIFRDIELHVSPNLPAGYLLSSFFDKFFISRRAIFIHFFVPCIKKLINHLNSRNFKPIGNQCSRYSSRFFPKLYHGSRSSQCLGQRKVLFMQSSDVIFFIWLTCVEILAGQSSQKMISMMIYFGLQICVSQKFLLALFDQGFYWQLFIEGYNLIIHEMLLILLKTW